MILTGKIIQREFICKNSLTIFSSETIFFYESYKRTIKLAWGYIWIRSTFYIRVLMLMLWLSASGRRVCFERSECVEPGYWLVPLPFLASGLAGIPEILGPLSPHGRCAGNPSVGRSLIDRSSAASSGPVPVQLRRRKVETRTLQPFWRY